jgi:hypothetical protein
MDVPTDFSKDKKIKNLQESISGETLRSGSLSEKILSL